MWALNDCLDSSQLFDLKHPLFFPSFLSRWIYVKLGDEEYVSRLAKKKNKKSVQKRSKALTGASSAVCCSNNTLKTWNHNTGSFSCSLSYTFILQCAPECLAIHPFLLSPVGAELVIQPPSSGGPLYRHPAYAPLHEAQRFLPGAHLLQQSPDLGLENSLHDKSNKIIMSVEDICCGLVFISLCGSSAPKHSAPEAQGMGWLKNYDRIDTIWLMGVESIQNVGGRLSGGFSPRKLLVDWCFYLDKLA